jgi:hypothetical protein
LDIRKNREYTGSVKPLRPTTGETGTKLHHREIFHKRFFLRKVLQGRGSRVIPQTGENKPLIATMTRLEANIETRV